MPVSGDAQQHPGLGLVRKLQLVHLETIIIFSINLLQFFQLHVCLEGRHRISRATWRPKVPRGQPRREPPIMLTSASQFKIRREAVTAGRLWVPRSPRTLAGAVAGPTLTT